jgi:hypothetical protein
MDDKELLWQRLKLQEEVRDRWFRYSLLILAVPLGVAAAFERAEVADRAVVAAGALLFFLIGVCFLLLHVMQRINSLELLEQLGPSDPVGDVLADSASRKLTLRVQHWGADFYANCAQSILNAGLFLAALYYGCVRSILVLVPVFLALVYAQLYLRQSLLVARRRR